MEGFTPFASLLGGALIGLAASLLLLGDGKVAGISGIVAGVLSPQRGDVAWRVVFLLGIASGALVMRARAPELFAVARVQPVALYVVAGLLVGYGTRLGYGCTSGHGVCGVSRLSKRSLVATASFMAAGFATVYVVRHVLGVLP
jgi:uncharacterized membrane protein YedE/YeeE